MKVLKKTESSYTPPSHGKKRRLRLCKPVDAIRILNQVVTGLFNDDIPTDKARCVIYACSTLPKLFEVGELEERVGELEKLLQQQRK